jgi:hypothetical protein
MPHEYNGRRIETEFIYPPIPDRSCDWQATFEGYEPPDCDGVGGDYIAHGPTEEAAVAALIELAQADEE